MFEEERKALGPLPASVYESYQEGRRRVQRDSFVEVAKIGLSSGAFYIYREQQERYIPVKFSVRGRDLGGAVLEAQQQVAEQGGWSASVST